MSEIKDFVLHLRLNYNFLILSAPFFLGALYLPKISSFTHFIFLFALIYIFLFGGANAYNSYFDKDEGPIGGLEHPPTMKKWMYFMAWIMQITGLILSFFAQSIFSILFIFSIILFWIYSSPNFRFKGKPILSFIVIGIGTVFNTVLMGYLAAGGIILSTELLIGAVGATLIILGMYPFSQTYQINEDKKRGDTTFAVKYGINGIKRNYQFLFLLGVLLLSYSFLFNKTLAIIIFIIGLSAYLFIWQIIKTISGDRSEYKKVMRTKYIAGLAFTLAMILLLIL